MKIGMVGLGRMGAGMAERLRGKGHEVVGYDRSPELSEVRSLEELVGALSPPRVVWVMVPAGEPTESTLKQLAELVSSGDVLIDGGNSYYKDSVRRAKELGAHGIRFLDIGTSGGIWGLEVGFCLMVGGPRDAFEAVEPILKKDLPGFGELFRQRSSQIIGATSALSRAMAGTVDTVAVFCLPGSPDGSALGMEIVLEILPHLRAVLGPP